MDKKSIDIFNGDSNRILEKAAGLYGVGKADLKKLGSFESFVYEFEREGRSHILKITHSIHRSKEQIMGELEWVNHLERNGVSVCRAIPTVNDEIVEVIDMNDSFFLIYAFDKAKGDLAPYEEWNDDLFRKWGRVIGRMHAIAKDYQPSDRSIKRFEWYEDESLKAEKHLPESQSLVIETCNEQVTKLRRLPVDRESYGIIHSDMHNGNLFVHDGEITVLDFDDCHYNWFTYDIAIPLFYVMRNVNVLPDDTDYARRFMGCFMDGYSKENRVDSFWMKLIPEFMKLREMDLYIIIHMEDAADLNGWCRRFMENRRFRIENDIPILDLDFAEFA